VTTVVTSSFSAKDSRTFSGTPRPSSSTRGTIDSPPRRPVSVLVGDLLGPAFVRVAVDHRYLVEHVAAEEVIGNSRPSRWVSKTKRYISGYRSNGMVRYLVLGFLFTVWGVLMTWKPYRLAKFGEQIDAIGSKRRLTKVEPTDWNVTLTRRLGPVLSFLGLLLLGFVYGS